MLAHTSYEGSGWKCQPLIFMCSDAADSVFRDGVVFKLALGRR